jgi:hypothetical protein
VKCRAGTGATVESMNRDRTPEWHRRMSNCLAATCRLCQGFREVHCSHLDVFGALGRIRTCNLLIRSQML